MVIGTTSFPVLNKAPNKSKENLANLPLHNEVMEGVPKVIENSWVLIQEEIQENVNVATVTITQVVVVRCAIEIMVMHCTKNKRTI